MNDQINTADKRDTKRYLRSRERADLLRYASDLTARANDPAEVMRITKGLAAWVDKATGINDREDRMRALERAYDNRRGAKVEVDVEPSVVLIEEATPYYEFLSAA